MSIENDNQQRLENVKRQAKRLAKTLDIPLTQAQFLLAKHIYLENSFSDIKTKIKSSESTGRMFLANVSPTSCEEVQSTFLNDLDDLLISIQNSQITAICKGNARELVLKVFGFPMNIKS
ncbi:hypothetical protein AB6T38_11060 [Aliiglaciecola sp. SL4]|jgi:hypothetical protein|uniref:hypothetical protein n=1 Tax=Aliiglaciecola sp. SL4 TaxID=3239806 RepID=UPI00355B0C13